MAKLKCGECAGTGRIKRKLGPYEFQCRKCRTIHHKNMYCIAQQAMGNSMTFTCECGHKQDVP